MTDEQWAEVAILADAYGLDQLHPAWRNWNISQRAGWGRKVSEKHRDYPVIRRLLGIPEPERVSAPQNDVRSRRPLPLVPSDRPVRVGLVTPSIVLGGAERWLIDMSRYCRVEWTGCASISPDGNSRLIAEMRRYMPVVFSGRAAVAEVAQTADVLIVWGVANLPELIGDYDGRVVLVTHGADMGYTRNVVVGSAGVATHYVAVGKACRRPFDGVVPWDKVTVLANGINAEWCRATRSREEVRAECGFNPWDRVIGYCGRLEPDKRPDGVLDALEHLPACYRGLIIGDGGMRPAMEERAAKKLHGRVYFTGSEYDEIGSWLQAMDTFVLVSPSEGFSLAIVEAAYCGVPVVCTPVGAVPELEEAYGKLFETVPIGASGKRIAAAIEWLDRTPWMALTGRGQAAIRGDYLAEHMGQRWTNYLRGIVS